MPNDKEPARGSLFERVFGDTRRSWREEKVLLYVIHRMSEDGDLRDVIQEEYVRRNCTRGEIERIVRHPELVHACRESLWRTFGSGELDPNGVRRRFSSPDTDDDVEPVAIRTRRVMNGF